MKIRTKLMLGTALVYLLCACALGAALAGMQGARERFERLLRGDQALLQAATGMYADGLQSGQALRDIVMDPANPTAYRKLEKADAEFMERGRKALQQVAPGSPEHKLLEEVLATREKHARIQAGIVALAATDARAATAAINNEETPVWRVIRQQLLDYIDAKNKSVEESKSELARYTRDALVVSLSVIGLALLAGGATMFLLVRNLVRELGEPAYANA